VNFIAHYPEWRILYQYRIGGMWRSLLRLIYPNRINFHIYALIKGGFFPQHSCGTFVNAKQIGSNFQVWQHVTIGNKYSGEDVPTIGNNVKICSGACVLGPIQIGNNVTIGANAVVLSDIPDNCIAVGVPAVVKREK
jgi:serine O-acetyltransferase